MLKGYTYRLHPTPAQAEFLVRTIGCARFIYNKLLEDRIAIREEAKAGTGTRRKPATNNQHGTIRIEAGLNRFA
ncbi:helix-turn-helix domain-containing protein [Exiguobacterium sp. ERU653]|uniref:helix-turn-helix domain-containing protein n=1 Tax=Exiguobacterium sp. ERU653 TaxID=2751254 RepID=UPI0020370EB5|nr:helix-turn-helix domain-containing protein [Exiguobacterium sp. ERU653]